MQRPRHVSLDDLVAHWCPCVLEVTCRCQHRGPVMVPLVGVAQAPGGKGPRRTLRNVLAHMGCSICQWRPVTVNLCEAVISADRKTWVPGWKFPLPAPACPKRPGKYSPDAALQHGSFEYWSPPVEMSDVPRSDIEDLPITRLQL